MKLSDFQRPATVDEARKALKDHGEAAIAVAGGTALHFMQGVKDKVAIDITGLGFDGIKKGRDTFSIGSTTRIADLVEYHEEGWALCQVASRLATNQVRHMSTVGGNIARVFPWADFPVALLALDGEVVILSDSEKKMAMDDYFKGQPAKHFSAGDLLKSVEVKSVAQGEGFGYHKEVRTAAGFSMITSAAKVEVKDGAISAARVAVGAAVGMPQRLEELEKALVGKKVDVDEIKKCVESATQNNQWKTKEGQGEVYTASLVQVGLTDAIFQAAQRAEKGERGGC